MPAVQNLIESIKSEGLLQKYRIPRLAIFGSYLHSDSPNDLDILIEDYQDYKDLILLREELSTLSGTHVDLVIEKYASPIIVHRAKKEALYVS